MTIAILLGYSRCVLTIKTPGLTVPDLTRCKGHTMIFLNEINNVSNKTCQQSNQYIKKLNEINCSIFRQPNFVIQLI